MSELGDPERLLAEALRAQARSAPAPGSPPPPPGDSSLPPRYGLLSGADDSALRRERAALEPPTVRRPKPEPKRLPVYWILVLAVLLGLATGAVIGLITLL